MTLGRMSVRGGAPYGPPQRLRGPSAIFGLPELRAPWAFPRGDKAVRRVRVAIMARSFSAKAANNKCKMKGSTSAPSSATMNWDALSHQSRDESNVAAQAIELGYGHGDTCDAWLPQGQQQAPAGALSRPHPLPVSTLDETRGRSRILRPWRISIGIRAALPCRAPIGPCFALLTPHVGYDRSRHDSPPSFAVNNLIEHFDY